MRATTQQGIPAPADVVLALLQQLRPHLPALPLRTLAALAAAVAAAGAAPPAAWAAELAACCGRQLPGAEVPHLVALLAALPALGAALRGAPGAGAEEAEAAGKLQALGDACVHQVRLDTRLDTPSFCLFRALPRDWQ